jgi:hypothetical protein
VAHPDAPNPERVLVRNEENGKTVVGALFKREREFPGPKFHVSAEAAVAIGLVPGAPTKLTVIAFQSGQGEETQSAEIQTSQEEDAVQDSGETAVAEVIVPPPLRPGDDATVDPTNDLASAAPVTTDASPSANDAEPAALPRIAEEPSVERAMADLSVGSDEDGVRARDKHRSVMHVEVLRPVKARTATAVQPIRLDEPEIARVETRNVEATVHREIVVASPERSTSDGSMPTKAQPRQDNALEFSAGRFAVGTLSKAPEQRQEDASADPQGPLMVKPPATEPKEPERHRPF